MGNPRIAVTRATRTSGCERRLVAYCPQNPTDPAMGSGKLQPQQHRGGPQGGHPDGPQGEERLTADKKNVNRSATDRLAQMIQAKIGDVVELLE